MRALVTGAGGFLGRHFLRTLESRGHDVDGVDIKGTRNEYGGPRDEPGDIRCHDSMYWEPGWYDLVVHCAAVVGGREVIDRTPLANAVDFELDAALFGWARKARPGRILYISSSAIYPVSSQLPGAKPLSEHMVTLGGPACLHPDSIYGWTKVAGEVMAGYARDAGIPVTVVRPFSGYGVDQDDSYPFRAMLVRARSHADPFEVWGDGNQVRDFIHVSDVVGAALRACELGLDGPVNLGTGTGRSMVSIAKLMCQAAGYEPLIVTRTDKPSGVAHRVADTARMSAFWEPLVTVEAVIRRTLAP